MFSPRLRFLFVFCLISIFLISCTSQEGALEPTSDDPYPALPQPTSGYPPPANTLPPPPVSTQIILTPGETHIDLPTPFPTFTLPPTPTSPFTALPTPLPLPTLAQDASGEIFFMAYENSVGVMYSFSVDAASNPLNEITSIPISGPSIALDNRVYPSPDGKRLLLMDGWGNASVFYFDTGELEPVFRTKASSHALFFNWHPDSVHILMRSGTGYQDQGLWLVNVDTGEHITLVSEYPVSNFVSAAISPNGQQLIYGHAPGINFPEGTWLRSIGVDNEQKIFDYKVIALSWSPDGQKIAFIGNGGLSIMDADGTSVQLLSTDVDSGHGFVPIWSPDSQWIAFMVIDPSSPLRDSSNELELTDDRRFVGATIHVVNVVTGKEHLLMNDNNIGHLSPSWSPDSSQIAFISIMSGKSEIWVANIDGTELRQLTTTDSPVRYPSWFRQ